MRVASAAAKGGAGPSAAAGAATAKGGGRISAAELRARARQQEWWPRAARSAAAGVATAKVGADGQGRRADIGGQGRRADLGGGAPGPSMAAGAAATSGSERGSRSGDGDEAKLRARVPAAGARGKDACFYFFCLPKMFWYRLVFPTGTNGCLRHRMKNLMS